MRAEISPLSIVDSPQPGQVTAVQADYVRQATIAWMCLAYGFEASLNYSTFPEDKKDDRKISILTAQAVDSRTYSARVIEVRVASEDFVRFPVFC